MVRPSMVTFNKRTKCGYASQRGPEGKSMMAAPVQRWTHEFREQQSHLKPTVGTPLLRRRCCSKSAAAAVVSAGSCCGGGLQLKNRFLCLWKWWIFSINRIAEKEKKKEKEGKRKGKKDLPFLSPLLRDASLLPPLYDSTIVIIIFVALVVIIVQQRRWMSL